MKKNINIYIFVPLLAAVMLCSCRNPEAENTEPQTTPEISSAAESVTEAAETAALSAGTEITVNATETEFVSEPECSEASDPSVFSEGNTVIWNSPVSVYHPVISLPVDIIPSAPSETPVTAAEISPDENELPGIDPF